MVENMTCASFKLLDTRPGMQLISKIFPITVIVTY